MPTTVAEQVIAVEDQVLDLIHQGQDAALSAVREISDAITSALPKVPEWLEAFTASLPKLPDWAQSYVPEVPERVALPSIDNVVDFSEKIWDSQRQFNQKLIDTITPIGTRVWEAARETAKATRGTVTTATAASDGTKAARKSDEGHDDAEETPRAAVNGSTHAASNRRIRSVKPEA